MLARALGALALTLALMAGSASAQNAPAGQEPVSRGRPLSEWIADLKAAGYRCIGLDSGAERAIDTVAVPERRALVLGAEGPGMRSNTREHCDALARLPISDAVESLNVSNAAAVALYAASIA